MTLHNSHVIKYWRWRIWLAKEFCRPLALTFLIEWHNQELEKSDWRQQHG